MLCAKSLGVPSSVDSTGDWEIVMSEVPSLEWGKIRGRANRIDCHFQEYNEIYKTYSSICFAYL